MNAALQQLLKETSRSFYLTLRVLPKAIRPQIGLAYLLARTTDTIADTELVPVGQRLDALLKLRERIAGTHSEKIDFSNFLKFQSSTAERILLERCEDAIAELQKLSSEDVKLVRKVLATITSGQELDLRRFASLESTLQRVGDKLKLGRQQIIALRTDDELDDYTYRVAGCVGEFWTKMCRAHLFPNAKLDDARLLANGVRFGKGLQLVNILRDLPADLQKGRCYLPVDKLAEIQLTPADLSSPANESKLRPLYNRYLDLAEAHLAAGWNYTNTIPRGQMRVRLACAWPILIGVKTIGRLRVGQILDPQRRIKISRAEVHQIIVQSILGYFWPAKWERLFVQSKEET